MLGFQYPLFDLFLSTFFASVLIFWLMLDFYVLTDLFRSADLSGRHKTLWAIALLAPLLGAFGYLVVRGNSTHRRSQHELPQLQDFEDYVRRVAQSKE